MLIIIFIGLVYSLIGLLIICQLYPDIWINIFEIPKELTLDIKRVFGLCNYRVKLFTGEDGERYLKLIKKKKDKR